MATIITYPSKDPDEVIDYQLSWRKRLRSVDTIASSSWAHGAGDNSNTVITIDYHTTTTTTVWLSGGTANSTAKLINTVVTAGGRTYEQGVLIPIKSTF